MDLNTGAALPAGVILAGGRGRRMGSQPKPLQILQGKPLYRHVYELALSQVDFLLVSSNLAPEQFRDLDTPVVADRGDAGGGPLAGIASAMQWLQSHRPETTLLATFPVDVPRFPEGLVALLSTAVVAQNLDVAWCKAAAQDQPLFAVWNLRLWPVVNAAVDRGIGGPRQLFPLVRGKAIPVAGCTELDFFNLNTPQDLLWYSGCIDKTLRC